jgi:hypothetical protein
VHAPRAGAAKARRPRAGSSRSSAGASGTYSHVKSNPAYKPGSQPGFVQAALAALGPTTKNNIADHIAKDPGWKWSTEAAGKAARWYVDCLVKGGFAKEN